MSVVVDSLPYFDIEPTEAERDVVDALVDAELTKHTPLHPSILERDEWQPSSSLMRQELDRAQRGESLQAIDLTRYENIDAPESGTLNDWRDAARRNIVAASAMISRSDNLAMLKSHGSNAWTMHVHQVEYALKQVESDLLAVRQDIDEVNVERKQAQVAAGERLTALDDRWRTLVSGNLELSVACAVLQQEIDQLKA